MTTSEGTRDPAPELPEALLDPAAFPRCDGAAPELVETHVSWVLLVGERVYKIKKPVDLGFLDATTLAARRRFCEEEVRLNRELAPGVHLGVVPIVRAGGRLVVDPPPPEDAAQAPAAEPEAVEWAVAMRRLPARYMLERLLEEGELDNSLIELLARRLQGFHAAAATGAGVDEHGTREAVRRNVRENVTQTRELAAARGEAAPSGVRVLSPALHAFLARAQERFLDEQAGLFARRVAEGRIRDGHGDLHASNICLEPDPEPDPEEEGGRRIRIFDRIEFSARLRCGDVAADLAFLAMDLDGRGFRAFSAYLARRYAELAQDPELGSLLPFYKTYRAHVRAKVGALAAIQSPAGSEAREQARSRAAGFFHLAASYHLPAALVLLSGLPASGKSFLARRIARPLGAALHASDATRKRLAGLAAASRKGRAEPYGGLYGRDASERTYAALREAARADLEGGRSVVVDASFAEAARRASFRGLARELGAPFALVHVTCSPEQLAERLAARAADPGEPSDADAAVHEAMRSRFEPPAELPAGERVEHRSGEPDHEATADLIDRLLAQLGAGDATAPGGAAGARVVPGE